MAQHNDWHLNTEHLSAYIDQQLSPQEQASFHAHLQTCQQCQRALADLRATVALLRAMPEPALPRSFILSPTVSYLQERPTAQQEQRQSVGGAQRPLPFYARRSLRAISALVAVAGLLFILTSAFTTLTLPHLMNAGSTASTSNPVSQRQVQSGVATPGTSTNPCHQPAVGTCTTPKAVGPSINATSTGIKGQRIASRPPSPPTTFDPNSPGGRLLVGAALLLLGIAGFVLTRRKRRESQPT